MRALKKCRLKKLLLSAISVVALILPLDGFAAYSAIKKDKLLFIKGTGDLFTDFRIKLTSTKIRIIGKMGGAIWREENPNTVSMYNNKDKVFVPVTIDQYAQEINQGFRPFAIEQIEGPREILLDGIKARVYQGFANVPKHGKQNIAEIVCIDNNWLSPVAHHAWCRILGLNRFDLGLPVSVIQKRDKVIGVKNNVVQYGSLVRVRVLQCNSIAELPASSESFSLPVSWKRGRDKGALFFSSDGNLKDRDLDDLFRTDLK
ncbi:hypothetical protein BH10CYA1_BH10CYA1_52990 [soil metagenome]